MDRSDYARYRAILRGTHARDGMTPFYSFGDGGWCDWTAPEVLFKGEHSLTRTPYGYMPTEAVQEMLRLRGEFDRGGWWTVLAWAAVCVSMRDTTGRAFDGLKRLEAVANRAIAHGERLKARVAELEAVIKRVNQLGVEMRNVERDEDTDHDGAHPLAVVISHLAKALGKECRMDESGGDGACVEVRNVEQAIHAIQERRRLAMEQWHVDMARALELLAGNGGES